jgi:DnaK suppressor protein
MDDNIKVTKEELKIRLENELLELKKEIGDIAIPDRSAPGGFDAKETNTQEGVLDQADQASEMTNINNNEAVLKVLQERLTEVEEALEKMKDGSYGLCEVCGEKIEDKRLLVNATAKTCIKHMEV